MDREFLDLYNQELAYLREDGARFASHFPAVAERLGGLLEDRSDPIMSGLLEGAAFLAARVQLKLKHEFSEFTSNLFDQLYPGALVPIPSMILAKFTPKYGDATLRDGIRIDRGSGIEAVFRERRKSIRCRFTLSSSVTLLPLAITNAKYLDSTAEMSALGGDVVEDKRVRAGLSITFLKRSAEALEEEPSEAEAFTNSILQVSACHISEIKCYFVGPNDVTGRIYEQIFGHSISIFLRYEDAFGRVQFLPVPLSCLQQIGFDPDDALMRNDKRLFVGFDFIRDYFNFPNNFLGFRLVNMRSILRQLHAKSFSLIFTFDQSDFRLVPQVDHSKFGLYATPAVNLFHRQADRVPVGKSQHEFPIIADRQHPLDFEVNQVLEVQAHFSGGDNLPVTPLYDVAPDAQHETQRLFYTVRRLPRRQSAAEKRSSADVGYVGTESFIAISGGVQLTDYEPTTEERISELSIKVLVSNRGLARDLPIGARADEEITSDFKLLDDTGIAVDCVAGPTAPRQPLLAYNERLGADGHKGAISWRLLNLMALSHVGLVHDVDGKDGKSLRDVLSIFAPLADAAASRQVEAVLAVSTRPVIRRLQQAHGTGVARGTEVTITLDDNGFDGGSAFLLGAVLDRFMTEYVSLNHFTQCVVSTTDRGVIMRWPPRAGSRSLL